MIYKTNLATNREDVIQGILSGIYRRYGGSVRVVKGQPGAGQFVTHLRDAHSEAYDLAPRNLDFVTQSRGQHSVQELLRQGSSTQEMLQHVTQFSAVGAVASVANLGVSMVGFAIVNHKLNHLTTCVSELHEAVQLGFGCLEDGLARVQSRLVELRLIALTHRKELSEVLHGVYDVKRALFADQMARLYVATRRIDGISPWDTETVLTYLDDIVRVRVALQYELEGRHLNVLDAPQRFLDTMMLYRGWSMAASVEVAAERQSCRIDEAAALAGELADKARAWARRWGGELVEDGVGGVARFGHSRFRDSILGETRERLFRLEAGGEMTASSTRTAETKGAIALELQRQEDDWYLQQAELANTLDFVEETTERIESMAAETIYCAQNRLGPQQWELLKSDR